MSHADGDQSMVCGFRWSKILPDLSILALKTSNPLPESGEPTPSDAYTGVPPPLRNVGPTYG
jgi:hypothetical protein